MRASKCPVIKLTEIVILWVYYTIPFGFSLIWHFLGITLQLLNYFVWPRITDEGSVPEMRIWSILLIKSDLKWCIKSLFIFQKNTWSSWSLCQFVPASLKQIDSEDVQLNFMEQHVPMKYCNRCPATKYI